MIKIVDQKQVCTPGSDRLVDFVELNVSGDRILSVSLKHGESVSVFLHRICPTDSTAKTSTQTSNAGTASSRPSPPFTKAKTASNLTPEDTVLDDVMEAAYMESFYTADANDEE